ncbi:class I SAM-dependent methyltransferase [Polluticoccus soli]|uniref:class I SAM-dependent methyltransferase n=1 Tax=Polluticoccus soli TaxID=3034150 RepID=UPI0023E24694|nr:class I SAM-dependent methyltransferase [Flavipsychrobacter sp. JY13-12]
MKTTGNYIIAGGEEGKKRLEVLSEVLYPYETALLQQQGLSNGMSFLDVGCGGGHISLMVAGIVGDTGHVTGIDFDKDIIELNRKEAIEQGITNVSYEELSAYDMKYASEFNMAYARFLLSHLTDPLGVLKNMVASVKSGGRIIVEDIHFIGHFSFPECKAFDDYVSLFTTAALQRRQNANIGPALPSLFAEAGLDNIGFDVIQPVFSKGNGKWMAYITMDKIRDAVKAQGLANEVTIQRILNEIETFTKDDTTIISLPRFFRVWGTKE